MIFKATFLMRAAVLTIGAVALLFSVMLFPEMSKETSMIAEAAAARISHWFGFVNYIFMAAIYAAAIPFFIALYQTFKLLGYIDKRKAFSELSVNVLKKIKYCAIAICGLYMVGVMPTVYCFAELDDAPGVILIGLVIGLCPFIIASFAAILQKLLQEAVNIKSENDLTI